MSVDLFIWDAENPIPVVTGVALLWRSFASAESPDNVSIPHLIEENADILKTRYLAWVYELGEMRIKNMRLIDHLQLRPGLSYWWMTLLVEKCNFAKSPQIDDAIRLLAFSEWAVGQKFERIALASSNQQLAECLRGWCEKTGVAFEWQRLPATKPPLSWGRRVYASLPAAMQAWVWLLKYLLERWPLRGVGLQTWRQAKGRTTFVSYSANCVPEAVQQGRYESRYWAHLPDVLNQAARPTNWLHLYAKDGLLPTAKHAVRALNAFNGSAHGQQCHVTLDAFIDLGVILKTVRDWLYLVRKGMQLGENLNPTLSSSLNFWPLLREDWKRSMFGVVAMGNLLFLNLFEAALKSLPKQRQGVYLQENMGWEFGFVNAWRAAGHGGLVGTPHSTVRFWDLRYFFDPRSYLRKGHNDLPLPDRVVCNGSMMLDAYQKGGYPVESLLDVEALRYLHLGNTQRVRDAVTSRTNEPACLLVLGDYLASNTQSQMRLLEQAVPYLSQPMDILVKPHPLCPIQPGDYPALRMRISMEPIAKLLGECDVAYASAMTSAAVDAYCAGVPIISVLDPNTLNLSPLRGCVGGLFANTPQELATSLVFAMSGRNRKFKPRAYFRINHQLTNWRKLLLE